MRKIVLVLTAAVMLAAVCFSGCKGAVGIDSGRTKDPIRFTAEPTQAVSPTDLVLPTSVPESLSVNENKQKASSFVLDVTLSTDEHMLTVEQTTDYLNPAGKNLSEIYFNIYPEAFSADGGGAAVQSIKLNGSESQLENVKGTVFKAVLASPLAADERCRIEIRYSVRIPNIKNRFGWQENIFNLGNFVITPAVYENGAYAVEPYVDIGDAFYTDIANYSVRINVPEGYRIAATGELGADGMYHAKNVRDFAFCASDSFETLTKDTGNTKITVYYDSTLPKTANRVLDVAAKSLALYGEKFGEYPYSTLSVVLNGLTGGVNGMEYPTLVMIAPEISLDDFEKMGLDFKTDESAAATVYSMDHSVCHEVAHQWFYGIVGNDQVKEAWLDEGFCRFCEFVYDEAYPPEFTADISGFETEMRLKLSAARVAGIGRDANMSYADDTTDLTKSLYYWNDEDPMGYSDIYDKGAGLLYAIYGKLGSKAFFDAVKGYVIKFKYDFVTTETFKEYWHSMADVGEIIDAYLSVPAQSAPNAE